ncbi:hypothetical protein ASE19_12040 [Nocardioides sp. Root79]|nr:hypothetical protein ASE19_12040 [Nocardioides sp. Root79]
MATVTEICEAGCREGGVQRAIEVRGQAVMQGERRARTPAQSWLGGRLDGARVVPMAAGPRDALGYRLRALLGGGPGRAR